MPSFFVPAEREEANMAVNYQTIVDAIDAAIVTGVSGPGELTADGETIKYRSLDELMRTRNRYASLAAQSAGKKKFQFVGLRSGSARI